MVSIAEQDTAKPEEDAAKSEEDAAKSEKNEEGANAEKRAENEGVENAEKRVNNGVVRLCGGVQPKNRCQQRRQIVPIIGGIKVEMSWTA